MVGNTECRRRVAYFYGSSRYYFIDILVPIPIPIPIPIPPAGPSESTTRSRKLYVRLLSYFQGTCLIIRLLLLLLFLWVQLFSSTPLLPAPGSCSFSHIER